VGGSENEKPCGRRARALKTASSVNKIQLALKHGPGRVLSWAIHPLYRVVPIPQRGV
jgi:hypothetical protein